MNLDNPNTFILWFNFAAFIFMVLGAWVACWLSTSPNAIKWVRLIKNFFRTKEK